MTSFAAVSQCGQAMARATSKLAPSSRILAASSSRAFTGAKFVTRSLPKASRSGASAGVVALFGTATAGGSVYDFTVKGIDGQDIDLKRFKGKALLIVNVASQCGFTPQYKEFNDLYAKYNKDGLEVLAFPCNQFGAQEPGSNAEIKAFAGRQGSKFPMFAKVDVNGEGADPFWQFLRQQKGGLLNSDVKWNFTKFTVGRDGQVAKRYGSTTSPADMEADIQALLKA